uniref:UDP-N-acetylglucosamine transferase subunit ALG14 n=1 Tax=Balaenoptera musculus TaxID=9771 RepID=A0A8C0CLW6_BALMU
MRLVFEWVAPLSSRRLAVRLWVVLRPRAAVLRRSLSLLVVAGSGGHTIEILRLLENLSDAYSPRHYIIADTDEMSARKINSFEVNRADRNSSATFPEYYIHHIPRSREVQQSWLSTVLTTLYSVWLSFPLTHRVKPDLVRKLTCSLLGYSEFRRTQQLETSLVVQWLRLCPPKAGGPSSIPGQGTRSCMLQLKDPACSDEDPACCNEDPVQ